MCGDDVWVWVLTGFLLGVGASDAFPSGLAHQKR
jgi:hypothetical protein